MFFSNWKGKNKILTLKAIKFSPLRLPAKFWSYPPNWRRSVFLVSFTQEGKNFKIKVIIPIVVLYQEGNNFILCNLVQVHCFCVSSMIITFDSLNWPKLISRKIRVADKLSSFQFPEFSFPSWHDNYMTTKVSIFIVCFFRIKQIFIGIS